MDYKKIEDLFVDFILNKIGPTIERENERNNYLSIIRNKILNILTNELPDYNTYVLPYGSFPIKTYLKNADIDITIFFTGKLDNKILLDLPLDLIDKVMDKIKEGLEKNIIESSYEYISEIKIIKADIRLLKCKIGSINIDISINNFAGLYKILFISYIEKQLDLEFNKKSLLINAFKEKKINIFRRILLLIKGWCFYEGNLMGSNIGLMATYTLEILVIYFLNLHYNEINNEFEAFEKFFELINKFHWEENIITLYDIISNFEFFKYLQDFNNNISIQIEKKNYNNINNNLNIKMKVYKDLLNIMNKPFWYLGNNINIEEKNNIINTFSNKCNEPLLNIVELKQFISPINSGLGNINIVKEENSIKSENFHKYVNILDPLNNLNNLGKSINFNSFSKMITAIKKINKQLKYIQDVRKKTNPYLYMNSLLNLFKITLSTSYVELFNKFLNTDLISNSIIYKKYNKNERPKITIDKDEMKKFNILFLDDPKNAETIFYEEEDFDDYEEEENIEENDSDKNNNNIEEEDNDEYEEEEEEKKEEYEIYDKDKDETDKNIEIKEYINFEQILNNDIIKDILEIKENKENIVKYYNKLLDDSKTYFDRLEKFLKSYNLI